jgi:hypothetical protein
MRIRGFRRGAALAFLLAAPSSTQVAAQVVYAPAESVTVALGPQYKAGGTHRLFFGSRYRKLWTTPTRVAVLRLSQFAGGLTPTEKGGGMQTKTLRFTGADGKEYQFRSLIKDPVTALPPELRRTFAADIFRDQMSSQHPAGGLVAASLLDAAGVLNAPPFLVQMADDPALGEFRAEFAGLAGTIEERPRELESRGATFAGARDIVSTQDLYEKLDEDPTVAVDGREFLKARLTDVWLGDWDRHQDQWRWALLGQGANRRWLPIPRDRDQVFVRFDGVMLSQARRVAQQLLNFGPDYHDMTGSTWNGRDLDRRFLTGLERPVWDSMAALLKARLSDQVIAAAVRKLPPEFYPLDGPRLERALKIRRDKLDEMAVKYYKHLAALVDVYGSDKADSAHVVREADRTTTVTLSHQGKEYYRRRFEPEDTDDVRVYLRGGNDVAVVTGEDRDDPNVRIIGGDGDDRFNVRMDNGTRLYDQAGQNRAEGAGINDKTWAWKADTANPRDLPPRDWGRRTLLLLTGYFATDLGAVIDYGGHTDWYGFRRIPYSTRLDYRLQYATARTSGRFIGGFTRQFENSKSFWELDLLASGIETLRWYGFGNETTPGINKSFHKVNQIELAAGLRWGSRFGNRNKFTFGPEVRWSNTDLDSEPNSTRFIAEDQPYGTGQFGMVGAAAELRIDGRDYEGFASKGAYFWMKASAFPKAWDLDENLARLEAKASFTLAPQGSWRPSLTLFAGGIKVFGDSIPFFQAARLGGRETLRGYNFDRFAGDAAVYGSAEARIPLTRLKLFIPGQQGVFGFYDVGQVYVKGETSDELHKAVGGGIWLSFLTRASVVYVGVAKPVKDKEGNRVLAGFGFPF